MTPPVIETERLRLRGHEPSDHDACASMWGDPEVTRFIGGRTSTREEAWGRMLRYRGMWELCGHGFWLVEDRVSGSFLGEIGVMDARRDMTPPLDAPEVGWALAPNAWGRGLAGEALAATLAWADDALGRPRLQCIIHPDNAASIRVAERAGFRERQRTLYHGDATIQFERPAPSGQS